VLIVDQILSLCSGIGGLDIGLHAGLRAVGHSPRTVCYVEREAFSVACLGKAIEAGRLDDAPIWLGDLQLIPLDLFPRIDIITGGYPCQPFSAAGKRKGELDPRHLWPSVLETVRALRPRLVFFENVAGHISMGLFDVLSDLEASGYRTAWGCYSASSCGAPHRRERVFILGMAYTGLHDETSRGERETASESRRERAAEVGSGCNARPGHQQATGEARAVEHMRSLGECLKCDLGWCEAYEICIDECDGCDLGDTNNCGRRQGNDAIDSGAMPSAGSRDWPGWPHRPGGQFIDEPPRTAEPRVGRNAHGLPDRVDRLRALGNAVVPQQAEMAFVDLWKELHK